MPAFVKTQADEKKWSRAKGAATDQDLKGDRKWRLANYIFHKMKNKKDKGDK